jgi:FkbM family methyltransferase
MTKQPKPLTVSDVPILKLFFKTSGWHDMSVMRFLTLLPTSFLWKRIALSAKDAFLNRYFGRIMGRYSKHLDRSFQFVYIGANDGVMSDTIMKYAELYKWQGVLVEPVPHLMETLKKNFAFLPKMTYEQVAIAEANGEKDLYTFRKTDYQPVFAQLLHSFTKESLLNTHISWGIDKEKDIVSIKVPTLTVESLLGKHQIENLDLLVVDTEGYDYTILKSMDFTKIMPKFIKFESLHMSKHQQKEIASLLQNFSYTITKLRGDYFCTRKD